MINIDLNATVSGASTDAFTIGAGVLGTSSSQWNVLNRGVSQASTALTSDTGAATGATISYTLSGSGSYGGVVSGTYAALGQSFVFTNSISFAGLGSNQYYDLLIYTGDGALSGTVNGVTKNAIGSINWNSLTEGTQYMRFLAQASGAGGLSISLSTTSQSVGITALQLQTTSAPAVPEPATFGLMGLALGGILLRRKMR